MNVLYFRYKVFVVTVRYNWFSLFFLLIGFFGGLIIVLVVIFLRIFIKEGSKFVINICFKFDVIC